MSFPILKNTPNRISVHSKQSTISVDFDGGYKQTRERFTRDLKIIEIEYTLMERVDKNAVESHYYSVRGSTPFDWTNLDTSITYSVRYSQTPTFEVNASVNGRYNVVLNMEEV